MPTEDRAEQESKSETISTRSIEMCSDAACHCNKMRHRSCVYAKVGHMSLVTQSLIMLPVGIRSGPLPLSGLFTTRTITTHPIDIQHTHKYSHTLTQTNCLNTSKASPSMNARKPTKTPHMQTLTSLTLTFSALKPEPRQEKRDVDP